MNKQIVRVCSLIGFGLMLGCSVYSAIKATKELKQEQEVIDILNEVPLEIKE